MTSENKVSGGIDIDALREKYLTPHELVPGVLFLALAAFLYFEWLGPYISNNLLAFVGAPEGVIEEDPVKIEPSKVLPFGFKGTFGLYAQKNYYLIKPVADYEIKARILHKRRYYSSANSADLVPYDIGLGWGALSVRAFLREYLVFNHSNISGRTLTVSFRSGYVPDELYQEVRSGLHMSNNHVVPASAQVADVIAHADTGDFIRLKGQLVDIERPDLPGWKWITTRKVRGDAGKNDHWGNGDSMLNMTDCDTMFVTEAEIIKPLP